MKIRKRGIIFVLVAATVLMLSVGSLAYFTDRVTGDVSATAGTLDLTISDFKASQTGSFKPGQGSTISYMLDNVGNKSADIREAIVVTYVPKAGTTSTINQSNPEFLLYAATDVTVDASTGVATIASGATPLSVVSTDGTQITYEVPQFIINGTGAGAEIEIGGVDAKAGAYVLVFNKAAGNDFQGATLTLEYVAQAKQHRNTNDATWTTVMSETITFGGADYSVVPAKN